MSTPYEEYTKNLTCPLNGPKSGFGFGFKFKGSYIKLNHSFNHNAQYNDVRNLLSPFNPKINHTTQMNPIESNSRFRTK
jgi:hypothetical protein